METLIAITFASLAGALCGFLYGLVWSRDRLEEAKAWMADAMDERERYEMEMGRMRSECDAQGHTFDPIEEKLSWGLSMG